MPLKDLKCNNCGLEELDVHLQRIEDIETMRCSKCDGKMRGMISAPSNYWIKGDNSASRRPAGIGAKNRGKK